MDNRIEEIISNYNNLRNTRYNDIAKEDLVAILKIVLYLNKFDIKEAKAGIVNFLSVMRDNHPAGVVEDIKRFGEDEEVLKNAAAVVAGISVEILQKTLYFSESDKLIDNFLTNYVPVWVNSNTKKNPNYNPTLENIIELFNTQLENSAKVKNNALDKDVSADIIVPSVNTEEINAKYDRQIKSIVDNPMIPPDKKTTLKDGKEAERTAELRPGPLYSNVNAVLPNPENGYKSPSKVPLGHDLAFLHTRLSKKYKNILNYIQATMDPRTYANRKDLPYVDEYSGIVDYLLMSSHDEKDSTIKLLMNAIQDNNYSNLKNSGIFVNGRYNYSEIYDKNSLLRHILATYIMWSHIEKSYVCEVEYIMATLNHTNESNGVLETLQSNSLQKLYTPELTYIVNHKPKFFNYIINNPKYNELLHSISGYEFSILLSKFAKVSEIDMMLDAYDNSDKEIDLDEYVTFILFIKGYINYFNVLSFSKEDFEQLYEIVKCASANDLEFVSGEFQNINNNNGVEVLNNWIKDKISYLSLEEKDKCKELDPEMLRSEEEKKLLVDDLIEYLIKLEKLNLSINVNVRDSLELSDRLTLFIKELNSKKISLSNNEKLQILNNPKLIQLNLRTFDKVKGFLSILGFSQDDLYALDFRKNKNILIDGSLYFYPVRYINILESLENSKLSENFKIDEQLALFIPQRRLFGIIKIIDDYNFEINNDMLESTINSYMSLDEIRKAYALFDKYNVRSNKCIMKYFYHCKFDNNLESLIIKLQALGLEQFVDYFTIYEYDEIINVFIYLRDKDLLEYADEALIYFKNKKNMNEFKEVISLFSQNNITEYFGSGKFNISDVQERIDFFNELKNEINVSCDQFKNNYPLLMRYLFDFDKPFSTIKSLITIVKKYGLNYFPLIYNKYCVLDSELEVLDRINIYQESGFKFEETFIEILNPEIPFNFLEFAFMTFKKSKQDNTEEKFLDCIRKRYVPYINIKERYIPYSNRIINERYFFNKNYVVNLFPDFDEEKLNKLGISREDLLGLYLSDEEFEYKYSIIEEYKVHKKEIILYILRCNIEFLSDILKKCQYIADIYNLSITDILNSNIVNNLEFLGHASLDELKDIIEDNSNINYNPFPKF